ncbi:hypothetical protein [Sulfuriflexus sp.]|uniref:hypothetical protein n=1 Tax=Sulfuriflexus sp. TaxID=2015443 RepID=UPI0028CE4A5E|nr:hypothetical protein [Sulfuriflexus sp.]MDT8405309.1 hypothetical protein [Sulfuriflexus sp.]
MFATILSTFALTSACTDQSDDKQPAADATDAGEVKKEWSEAMESLKAYSITQRDEALVKAEETIDAMDKRIDEMESRASQGWQDLSADIRQRREATLSAMQEQREALAEQYEQMKASSSDTWDDVKKGFIDSYNTLSSSLDDAQSDLFGEDTKKE